MSRVEVIGNATLYNADCRDVLPALDGLDAIITDMPYGTGWAKGGGKRAGEFNAQHEKPDWDVFTTDWIAPFVDRVYVATFCAPSFLDKLTPAFKKPHVGRYRKTNVRPGGREFEFIVANAPWTCPEWEIEAYNGDNEFHPTQKPLEVMMWCVANAPGRPQMIADPFMGSGTTGVAVMNLHRRFIGIEREPRYFDIACKRIDDAQRQGSLFAGEAA